ncbi:MAG: ribosome maturation factor RimP [Thermodesulfobacteriota bacterium]
MTDEARQAVWQRIEGVVRPVLRDLGLELVELLYRPESHGWVVRIYIHKPGGVSIDDCTRVSREVSVILDVEDFIPQRYALEVSSPGLERPLRTARDFERNLGSKVRLTLAGDDGTMALQATIKNVAGDDITVENNKEVLVFPIGQLLKAKLII